MHNSTLEAFIDSDPNAIVYENTVIQRLKEGSILIHIDFLAIYSELTSSMTLLIL